MASLGLVPDNTKRGRYPYLSFPPVLPTQSGAPSLEIVQPLVDIVLVLVLGFYPKQRLVWK